MRTSGKTVFLVFLALFTSVWFGSQPASAAQNDNSPAKVALNPPNVASLSLQPGSTITFEVNVTNASPFSGFIIGIFYNVSILRAIGIDFSGGVLGDDAIVADECVNFLCSQGVPDLRYDGEGVASLVLFTNSGNNATAPPGASTINGKLFSLAFDVIGTGFSTIHFVHQELQAACLTIFSCPNGISIVPSVSYDGYFTNTDCPSGSGNLCKPPIVTFTPPLISVLNQPEIFKASASSQNPNGMIREYNWTWASGLNKKYYNSPPQGSVKPESNVTIVFRIPGSWVVSVSAQDNYGARAYFTLTIKVSSFIEPALTAEVFLSDPTLNPLPLDKYGSPTVNVLLTGSEVKGTSPPQILAWVYVTNTGATTWQSIKVNETLPVDWKVSPQWLPAKGSIHVYFGNSTSLATNPDITDPSTITLSIGNPETVTLAIPDLNRTGIGHPLLPGQHILLSAKLSYSLVKTEQQSTSYPRYYDYDARSTTWSQPSYGGIESSSSAPGIFRAYATTIGDRLVSFGSTTVMLIDSQN